MSPPQFVLEDDGLEERRLRSSDLPRYSDESIEDSGLDRSVFEKDERFRDEAKMELGDEEEDGFIHRRVPVSLPRHLSQALDFGQADSSSPPARSASKTS
jgi:hypothetical protein